MKEYCFAATLQDAGGGGVFIPYPYNAKEEFRKARVPIDCTVDGESYRGTMVKYGTSYHVIIVIKAIREKIKKAAGDKVKVILKEDNAERTIRVPDDFKKLLKKYKLEYRFNKMSYSHRKECTLWINSAKKDETRLCRMHKTIEKLKEKF